MQISAAVQTATDLWVREPMNAHFALLSHLTVRLFGRGSGQGRDAGNFNGTGVIARIEGDRTFVLTAKHNIHVAGRALEVAERQAFFTRNVRVYFRALDGTETNHAVTSIYLPDAEPRDTGYDVAVLHVDDAALAGAVRALAPANSLRAFCAAPEWRRDGQTILRLVNRDDARGMLFNGQPYPRGQVIDAQRNHVLFQLGHGKVGPGETRMEFRHRVLPVAELGHPTYMDRTHADQPDESYLDVYAFDATAQTSTTQEGDSGGPVFAIHPSGLPSYLVGLALGANYFPDHSDGPNDPTVNNAFTVVVTDRLTRFA